MILDWNWILDEEFYYPLSATWIGNPKCVSTYEDEHENGVVARVGLHTHGSSFARTIFERIELQNPERRMLGVLPVPKNKVSRYPASVFRSP
jgi:hypothetical protein